MIIVNHESYFTLIDFTIKSLSLLFFHVSLSHTITAYMCMLDPHKRLSEYTFFLKIRIFPIILSPSEIAQGKGSLRTGMYAIVEKAWNKAAA